MIYNAYDSTKYLLDLYEQYMPDALASGGFNKEDLVGFFDAFGVAGKINLMIKVLNDLEIFDALLAPITVASSNPTMVEMWANGIGRTQSLEVKVLKLKREHLLYQPNLMDIKLILIKMS